MAKKFVSIEEAAKILGVNPGDVTQLREKQQLHGYRDGGSWKFKAEDVEKLAQERATSDFDFLKDSRDVSDFTTGGGDDEIVLVSDLELGEATPGGSSTIIGQGGPAAGGPDSDLKLGGDKPQQFQVGGSGIPLAEDLEQGSLGSDLSLAFEDSNVKLGADVPAKKGGSDLAFGSDVLAVDDSALSAPGSDVTLGGADSGINLVNPSDSGISLSEPVELGGSDAESLMLGDAGETASDDSFELTPLEEVADESTDDSGSQVIALDTDIDFGSMSAEGEPAAAMLEEESPGMGMMGMDAGMSPVEAGEMAPMLAAAEAPQVPYTGLNVAALVLCFLVLAVGGMMSYDLMRNMWSWDAPYKLNSSLMDTIVGMFEK